MEEGFGEQFEEGVEPVSETKEPTEGGVLSKNGKDINVSAQESIEAGGEEDITELTNITEVTRRESLKFLQNFIDNLDSRERELRETIHYEAPVFEEINRARKALRRIMERVYEERDPGKYMKTRIPVFQDFKRLVN